MVKTPEEFENFNRTMHKLIKVSHEEIKTKLAAEKAEKKLKRKQSKRQQRRKQERDNVE